MVKQARKLKFGSGILAESPTNPGRSINDNTIEIVQKYYENDEISRMLPGKNDLVSMKAGNVRVHRQKRLILMNLNELYSVLRKITQTLPWEFQNSVNSGQRIVLQWDPEVRIQWYVKFIKM